MKAIKKITSFVLIAIVLMFTVISILGIWEIISFQDIIKKTMLSLFVVFVATVVVLFIYSVLIKEEKEE